MSVKILLKLIFGGLIDMNERVNGNSWIPLIVVACASFIIVLDTLFMNVSISKIVVDLNTDVVQFK